MSTDTPDEALRFAERAFRGSGNHADASEYIDAALRAGRVTQEMVNLAKVVVAIQDPMRDGMSILPAIARAFLNIHPITTADIRSVGAPIAAPAPQGEPEGMRHLFPVDPDSNFFRQAACEHEPFVSNLTLRLSWQQRNYGSVAPWTQCVRCSAISHRRLDHRESADRAIMGRAASQRRIARGSDRLPNPGYAEQDDPYAPPEPRP